LVSASLGNRAGHFVSFPWLCVAFGHVPGVTAKIQSNLFAFNCRLSPRHALVMWPAQERPVFGAWIAGGGGR
jgi:hypothetical protein